MNGYLIVLSVITPDTPFNLLEMPLEKFSLAWDRSSFLAKQFLLMMENHAP
jgi:hypothetical protein